MCKLKCAALLAACCCCCCCDIECVRIETNVKRKWKIQVEKLSNNGYTMSSYIVHWIHLLCKLNSSITFAIHITRSHHSCISFLFFFYFFPFSANNILSIPYRLTRGQRVFISFYFFVYILLPFFLSYHSFALNLFPAFASAAFHPAFC